MPATHPDTLQNIKRFDQLVAYLRDELDWPIETDDFDDLTFDYEPEELGIDPRNTAKIEIIKQLRPLTSDQPWGVFWIKFKPQRLPVVALRRILGQLVVKKRATADRAERPAWVLHDLLLISAVGEDDERQINFAHFADESDQSLPTLRVLGWDGADTILKLDHLNQELHDYLTWPKDESNHKAWRTQWSNAFKLRHREVINTSTELSVRLAELARNIRLRCNSALALETEKGPLRALMGAFKQTLIHKLNEEDFADMYAQTIAYGLLSARVSRHVPGKDAGLLPEDVSALVLPTNPFLKELMQTFFHVGGRKWSSKKGRLIGIDFDELGINDVVELLKAANMDDVLRDFEDKNPQKDPVIHFYELFLKEYDAEMRIKRGVFYTPRPVVSFIVRSVDELLRTEFGLADGLADTSTWSEMIERNPNLNLPEIELTNPETKKVEKKPIDASKPFVQILDSATGTGTFLVEVIDLVYKTMTAKWEKDGYLPLEYEKLWNDYVPSNLLPRLHGYELMMAPYAIAHMKIGLKLYETGYRFESGERVRVYLTNALEPPKPYQMSFDIPALVHEAEAVNAIKRDQQFTVVIGNPPYSTISQNVSPWIKDLVASYMNVDTGRMIERGNRNHLQDDYVKFLRLGQHCITSAGVGILGHITNDSYLGGSWYRGMRYQLCNSFDRVSILGLNGGVGFSLSHGDQDENVFDIKKSVAISLFIRGPEVGDNRMVKYSGLIGSREHKYARLSGHDIPNYDPVVPKPSNQWSFLPLTNESDSGWSDFAEIIELFELWGEGAKTNRDGLALGMSRDEVVEKARDFGDLSITDSVLETRYSFGSNYQWTTDRARARFTQTPFEDCSEPYLRRPFDRQFVYWHRDVVYNMRGGKLDPLRQIPGNKAFLFSRTTTKQAYTNFFVSDSIPDCQCLYNCKAAPLFTSQDGLYGNVQINLSVRAIDAARRLVQSDIDDREMSEQFFSYIYALAHSSSYRSCYANQLRRDYPRFPINPATMLFQALYPKGSELILLHLGQDKILRNQITTKVGSGDFRVEKASYADETVWIDKAKTRGFRGVPEDVWNFHIGGHQICHKWLKDRGPKKGRPGRILTADDLAHYQMIVVALNETIRIMAEIDETIDTHGGWPDAFTTNPDELEKLKNHSS